MTTVAELLPPPPFPTTPRDRRRFERQRVREIVATQIGRASGALVDLSTNGARVRHTAPLIRGSQARLTFNWNGARFEAAAEVLASRVVSLARPTRYESRLRFVTMSSSAEHVLARALADIAAAALRTWVANLRGWENVTPPIDGETDHADSGFLRCRYVPARGWERKWTKNPDQPKEGFTVPASTEPAELNMLCLTYETSDEEGRALLRVMTDAVVQAAQRAAAP
jgi:hypothetical protein